MSSSGAGTSFLWQFLSASSTRSHTSRSTSCTGTLSTTRAFQVSRAAPFVPHHRSSAILFIKLLNSFKLNQSSMWDESHVSRSFPSLQQLVQGLAVCHYFAFRAYEEHAISEWKSLLIVTGMFAVPSPHNPDLARKGSFSPSERLVAPT